MILKRYSVIFKVFALLNVLVFQATGANNDVKFYNLNEEYGVSIRETNQALSDDYGFIWISSKMGIVRYTPGDIRTYQLPYESEDVVTVRLVYANSVLYAYTNNGQIFRYNSVQDEFEIVINVSKLLSNPFTVVTRMLVDKQDKLWIATSFGLYCHDAENGLKAVLESNVVFTIEWYDAVNLFYATNGQIKVLDTRNFSQTDYFTFPDQANFGATQMLYDQKQNALWIGTVVDGVLCLEDEGSGMKARPVPGIPAQPIMAIEASTNTTILVGIDGQGLWKVNKRSKQVMEFYKENQDDPHSLKGNGVYDVYCDDKNRVWVCTYSAGVSFFDQANTVITEINYDKTKSLNNNDVNNILEDSDGNIWFATNNGISHWNVSTNRWKYFYHNTRTQAQVFHALCEDNQGRIWAGTYSSGVYVLDRQTGEELKHYSTEKTDGAFNNNFVLDIYKDSQGNIWIGGAGGDLICYLADEDRFRSFRNYSIKAIEEYKRGRMLIGSTVGLSMLDVESGINEQLVGGFIVHDILVRDSVAWLCTSGSGVLLYNLISKELKKISVDSGLPSNFTNSITFSKGYFWVGTEQGLCKLNEDGDSIITFSSLPALSNVSFNRSSYCNLRNGNLIWGTNKGALSFDPAAIPINQYQGKIFFQDMTISGRSIRNHPSVMLDSPLDSLKELSLKYFQNTVSLELVPMGLSASGAKFSWKMEGLDTDWSKPSSNRFLSYSNISSGNYLLRIRMVDSSLTTTIDERVITLHLVPPFWETWWFRVLIFCLVFGISIFGFLYYIDHLKKQQSEEKIRFFANTAHDIRTSLTLLNGPIEELNKSAKLDDNSRFYLQLATEQTQRLSNVVTQLMDFQKVDVGKEKLSLSMNDIVKMTESRVTMFESYAESKNIELKFTANCSEFVTAFDESMIEKVIDNLISNAIKYSMPAKPVSVSLECSPGKWTVEVQDRGIGIDRKAQKQLFREFFRGENAVNSKIVGSGIGLLLVKNYVDLHGGRVNFNSQINVGSTFQVTIPFIRVDQSTVDRIATQEAIQTFAQPMEAGLVENAAPDDSGSLPEMKVLVVEDNDNLRGFLHTAMAHQFQVSLARDGQQAWEIIGKEAPDLVVSDIMMPNMDGFELCQKMKSTYETSHIPVILLTSLVGKAQQLKGLGLGADDYLTKPFDVTLLQQRIKSIIKNREAIRDKALKIIKVRGDEMVLGNELNDQFLKRIVEVVRENIDNPDFSRDEFAMAMNVSASLLYKKIKALTNQSPTDFIRSVRLNHALDLLKTKEYSVTEVSELCGFASVSYFGMVFRKHYGKSPSQIF